MTERSLHIGTTRIADDAPCYVIAELGHNHQGLLGEAVAMIKAAAQSGAHAVKLQKRDVEHLYLRSAADQPYTSEHSFGLTYGAHRHALEFGWQEYVTCRALARAQHLHFFATAFDEASADFLMRVDVPAIKIASGDLLNKPLLQHVAGLGVPVILSTGGGTMCDIDRAVQWITAKTAAIALLHCTAAYPVRDFGELNLRVIPVMRERYPGLIIGWSGHDHGIAMATVAYTLGARIIEKHVTLNRAAKGSDHAFSLEPHGLKSMCRDLGRARLAMGDGIKRRYQSEEEPLTKMGKCLAWADTFSPGHVIARQDLCSKSPRHGSFTPDLADALVGSVLQVPVEAGMPLSDGDFPAEM